MSIKSNTLILLCLLLKLSKLIAQNNQEPVFTLYPLAGINACQIHGDSYNGYNKFGVNGGIQVNSRLGKKISLDLGIVFTQKGARKNQKPDDGDFTYYRVNLNYVEIPLLLRYQLNKHYFITGGSGMAYLISYSEDNEYGNWNGVYPFNSFEFTANIGLGRDLNEKWLVEVRSGNSFLPIRNYGIIANNVYFPNALARFFNRGLYNNILSVSLFYKIKPKQRNESQP